MDQEFLKEIRASNAASLTKTEAIVSASKAFVKLANGMLNKFKNMQSVVSHLLQSCIKYLTLYKVSDSGLES